MLQINGDRRPSQNFRSPHQVQPELGQPKTQGVANRTKSMLSKITDTKKPFYMNYKNINFDNLKERHDNFSFEKAIDTKTKIYDSLHFQGIHAHPHNPQQVLFRKAAQNALPARHLSSVDTQLPQYYPSREDHSY